MVPVQVHVQVPVHVPVQVPVQVQVAVPLRVLVPVPVPVLAASVQSAPVLEARFSALAARRAGRKASRPVPAPARVLQELQLQGRRLGVRASPCAAG